MAAERRKKVVRIGKKAVARRRRIARKRVKRGTMRKKTALSAARKRGKKGTATRRPKVALRKKGKRKAVKARAIKRASPRKVTVTTLEVQQGKPTATREVTPVAEEQEIGKITHFFTHINVGVLDVANGTVSVGDKIRIIGETTDFTQTVTSMQLEHQQVEKASAGQSVGLKVEQRVREHDKVYLVE